MTNVKLLPIAQVYSALSRANILSDEYYTDKYLQGLYTYRTELKGDAAYYSESIGLSLTPHEYLYRKLEQANYVYISTKLRWMKLSTKPLQLELIPINTPEETIVP